MMLREVFRLGHWPFYEYIANSARHFDGLLFDDNDIDHRSQWLCSVICDIDTDQRQLAPK